MRMTSVRPLRPPPPPEPPALHARAMDNLAFIRDTMEAAGSFTAVSGWGMVAVGALATIVAVIARSSRRRLALSRSARIGRFSPIGISLRSSTKSAARRCRSVRTGKDFVYLIPPDGRGTRCSLSVTRAEWFRRFRKWMSFTAQRVAGGAFREDLPVMMCFMAAGVLALFSPMSWSQWIMGAAFGGLHILFGIPIARRHGG